MQSEYRMFKTQLDNYYVEHDNNFRAIKDQIIAIDYLVDIGAIMLIDVIDKKEKLQKDLEQFQDTGSARIAYLRDKVINANVDILDDVSFSECDSEYDDSSFEDSNEDEDDN